MRIRRLHWLGPWILVASVGVGSAGIGPVLGQAINEPGWPPPEGAACKPTKAAQDEAKTLYNLGKNAYDTSNYPDAIKYWKDAYKRDCNAHLLLKNLGRAYESNAQYAQAVEAYKLYRQRGGPKGEELDTLDQKIANLSAKVATTSTTTTTTTTATETSTTTATTTAPTDTATTTTTATTAPTSTSTAGGGGGGGPGVVPWVVTGVGGAVAITGAILWITGNSKVTSKADDFNAIKDGAGKGCNDGTHNPNINAQCNAIASDGNSAKTTRTIGIVLTGVGVAAAAGGLIWALTSSKGGGGGDTAGVHVVPGPGLAGIGLAGSF